MARNGNAKTKHVALNMLKAGVAIFGAALLFACGDDDSSFVASENGGSAAEADIVVTIFDDLPNCTGKREGVTAYVKDEKTAYVCTDGDWVVAGESGDEGDGDDDDGDDAEKKSSSSKAKSADSKGKSSSDKEVSSSSVTQSRSSSVAQSSSSSVTLSEVEGSSSSSVIPGSDPESSSSVESSSSRGFFEMSKDEFLNPKISYGKMTDSRDNKTYKTVKIGTQVWMAENLNYAYTGFEYDYSGYTSDSISWCYLNDASNCEIYGRLYTWAAAVGKSEVECGCGLICDLSGAKNEKGEVRGICPEGWHLPSYDEWLTLFTAVGGSSKAGTALKSQTGWKSQTGDAADRDAYGFSALPAGYRSNGCYFSSDGYDANFWSASEYDGYYAYLVDFYHSYEHAPLYGDSKYNGFSVRCLQN